MQGNNIYKDDITEYLLIVWGFKGVGMKKKGFTNRHIMFSGTGLFLLLLVLLV